MGEGSEEKGREVMPFEITKEELDKEQEVYTLNTFHTYYDVSWTVIHFDDNDDVIGEVEVEVTFVDNISHALALIEATSEPNKQITLLVRRE